MMILRTLKDWVIQSNKIERIWLLAKIEFKLRYYENKLGLLWALLKPISEIFIFYIAFEVVLKQGIPNFVSFLFLALILWNFFVESTTGTIQILNNKKYLYEYTNMNKIEIYLSTILSNCIGFLFNFILFLLYFHFFDKGSAGISIKVIWIIPIFINLALFALAFSMILSNIYVIAKDVTQVWMVITGIGFWLSPILFKLDTFRQALPGLDYLNPISGLIINARNVVLYQKSPEWELLGFGWGYAILFLLLGFILLNKVGKNAAERL